jgi:hypothetical protein
VVASRAWDLRQGCRIVGAGIEVELGGVVGRVGVAVGTGAEGYTGLAAGGCIAVVVGVGLLRRILVVHLLLAVPSASN